VKFKRLINRNLYNRNALGICSCCDIRGSESVAIPLLSYLYVRKVAVEAMNAQNDWEFRTHHQLELDLYHKIIQVLRSLDSRTLIIAVLEGANLETALVYPLGDERGSVPIIIES